MINLELEKYCKCKIRNENQKQFKLGKLIKQKIERKVQILTGAENS